jgi:hypothetical protein
MMIHRQATTGKGPLKWKVHSLFRTFMSVSLLQNSEIIYLAVSNLQMLKVHISVEMAS